MFIQSNIEIYMDLSTHWHSNLVPKGRDFWPSISKPLMSGMAVMEARLGYYYRKMWKKFSLNLEEGIKSIRAEDAPLDTHA